MIKRTIEISSEAAHLCVRHQQLLVKPKGRPPHQVPCEDLGMVLVDHPGTTYSHAALSAMADADVALVVCGADHLPNAILLPIGQHSQVVWRIQDQINASKPLQKNLWKQIVQAKVTAQANNLPQDCPARTKLKALAGQVRSGDPQNIEAQAARVYWSAYMPEERFRRDASLEGTNALLNYGYSVMRAATARTLVAAGLLPALGLHHCNRSNAFCLADDLMEPLRPLVDDRVRSLVGQGYEGVCREAKQSLLQLLSLPMQVNGERGPMMVHLHRTTASLVKCYQGTAKKIDFATPCDSPEN